MTTIEKAEKEIDDAVAEMMSEMGIPSRLQPLLKLGVIRGVELGIANAKKIMNDLAII